MNLRRFYYFVKYLFARKAGFGLLRRLIRDLLFIFIAAACRWFRRHGSEGTRGDHLTFDNGSLLNNNILINGVGRGINISGGVDRSYSTTATISKFT